MNLSVRVFIVTGAFDDLGQAVTACMLAPAAKLAHVSKRAGPPLEHRAGDLLYAAVDLSQKDAAAEVVELAFKEAGREDGLVNLASWFHRDKLEGIEDSSMWRDVLVQRAPQSNISDAGPLFLMVAQRCIEERRKAHIRTSFFQWNYESPWLALNQCIAQEEWTTPTHSWIAQHG